MTDAYEDEIQRLHKNIANQYPGINEIEAICYAKGFIRGLLAGGMKAAEARVVAMACSFNDTMLAAGSAYTTQNMLEAAVAEAHGELH